LFKQVAISPKPEENKRAEWDLNICRNGLVKKKLKETLDNEEKKKKRRK
jgi:hypothetical protein